MAIAVVLMVGLISAVPSVYAQGPQPQQHPGPQADDEPQTLQVTMRDGTMLTTDIYLPAGPEPWPVLLIRTPYGRAGSAEIARDYSALDLVVVVQDMRGRGDSGGQDPVYRSDGDGQLQDGFDTFSWIRAQPWAHGSIATFGGSALGIVQYIQASANPPGLAFLHASAATANLYDDIYFPGGVFREKLALQWLKDQDNLAFVSELEAHPYKDDFWDVLQAGDHWDRLKVPGLHIGGWFDIFSQGTIDAFLGYQHQGGPGARGRQKLIMGPWTHAAFHQRQQGELRFPDKARQAPYPVGEALNTLLEFTLNTRWSDLPDNPGSIPPVQYYVMGNVDEPSAPGNHWRSVADWPPPAARARFYLHPEGRLSEQCPASQAASSSWNYEPANPVTTLCGANLYLQAGPCDHRPNEQREDVLTFTSETLKEPLEITGRLTARLHLSIDQPDSDVVVWLSDVYPDGRSMLITEGAARLAARGQDRGLQPLTPDEILELEVDLLSTSIILDRGHRLRVAISSSNSPRYLANRNNGLAFGEMQQGPALPVRVQLHHDAARPSHLELPLPARAQGDVPSCPQQLQVERRPLWLLGLLTALLAGIAVLGWRAARRAGRRGPPPNGTLMLACLLLGACSPSPHSPGNSTATDDDSVHQTPQGGVNDDDSGLGDEDKLGNTDLPLGGLGSLTGDCDVLDGDWLDSSSKPALYRNVLDFAELEFDRNLLSEDAQQILDAGNLGGSSLHSEVFAFEVLYRCERAELLKTEGDIDYSDPAGKKTDLLVRIDDISLGLSVTRAFAWPPDEPFTTEQAHELLEDKLNDVLLSTANVSTEDAWERQILSVIAYAPGHSESVANAWLELSPELRANTVIMVTTTEGNDGYIY
ncbi:MAG: hypothetical protein CMP23_16095 [Rickettsiales bacterium]|nr:hypothetical protein [Rickettsiales bacterium]